MLLNTIVVLLKYGQVLSHHNNIDWGGPCYVPVSVIVELNCVLVNSLWPKHDLYLFQVYCGLGAIFGLWMETVLGLVSLIPVQMAKTLADFQISPTKYNW